MNRRSWMASAVLGVVSAAAWGCGGPEDGAQVQLSPEAAKGDQAVQDAMKALMQSKKGGKKAAAKAEEPKAEAPKAEAPKAEEPKAE